MKAENTTGVDIGQDNIDKKLSAELLTLATNFNRLLVLMLLFCDSEAGRFIFARAVKFLTASFVPSSGTYSLDAISAMLNRSEKATREAMDRIGAPHIKPTKDRMHSAEDIARLSVQTSPPYEDEA